jgi:hypothetical protein
MRNASSNAHLTSRTVLLQLVAALWFKEQVFANAVPSLKSIKIVDQHVKRQGQSQALTQKAR